MFRITCADLGIVDCDFYAEGETPADVIEQVREHLNKHYDMDLPKTDDILDGDYELNLFDDLEEDERLVIRRLREKLHVGVDEPEKPGVIIPPVIPPHGGTMGGGVPPTNF